MASLNRKFETERDKDKRPCEPLRRNAYHAPRSASTKVPPCEHARPQTVSADDTVVGYSEQTPTEAPLGNEYFMIQLPGRTAWRFFIDPSSSTSSTTPTSAIPTTT